MIIFVLFLLINTYVTQGDLTGQHLIFMSRGLLRVRADGQLSWPMGCGRGQLLNLITPPAVFRQVGLGCLCRITVYVTIGFSVQTFLCNLSRM